MDRTLDRSVGQPADFLITAVPAFFLRGVHHTTQSRYRLLQELHLESQYVLRRKRIFRRPESELFVYQHSSAEEHIRLSQVPVCKLKVAYEPSVAKIVASAKDATLVVAWEPLASVLERRGWQRVDNTEHSILIGIFCERIYSETKGRICQLFLDIFLSEWIYCLTNFNTFTGRSISHKNRRSMRFANR